MASTQWCWRHWLMPLQVHSLLSLKGRGDHRRSWCLEKVKRHTPLQERQGGGAEELQSHLSTWEGDGINPSGSHFEVRKGQEGGWEEPSWLQQRQIRPDQSDSLLWWDDCLDRHGRAVDVVYLNLSKAFGTISYRVLRSKFGRYALGKWTIMPMVRIARLRCLCGRKPC